MGLFAGILLHDSPSHVGQVHRSVGRLPCEPLSIIHKSHLAIGFSVITHCTFSSPQLARTKQRKLNSHVLNSTNSFQKMCLQYNMVCTVMWCSYSRSRCWKRHAQQHTRPRMRSLSRIILASMRPSKPFNKFKPLPRLPAPSVKTWTYLYRELLTNARLHHCVRQKLSNFCSHTAGTLCPVPDRPSMLADTSISHRGIVHDIKYVHVFKKDIKVTETCWFF